MANPEHIEVVRAGAESLAEWRLGHPNEPLVLDGASLQHLNLANADMQGADLRGADLTLSDLEGARLSGALMPGAWLESVCAFSANFSGATLKGAKLTSAACDFANFTNANLQGAGLFGTNLTKAHLDGASLAGVHFFQTVLGDVSLARVEGLEQANYEAACIVDEQTLRKSWPLPETFLRGVGLSDELIAFCHATFGRAIEFYSCFISYSSKDDDFAKRLHADLQDKGVRCWFAPEDLKIGDRFRPRIDEAIRLHDKLLLILSEHSVQSPWVESEVEAAFEKERNAKERGEERTVLFPIRLDDAVMESEAGWAAEIRRTRHIGDFTRWKEHDEYQKAFDRLMRDLKQGDAAKPRAT